MDDSDVLAMRDVAVAVRETRALLEGLWSRLHGRVDWMTLTTPHMETL